jgi:surfactin synthase thioesterase subunit
MTRNRTSIDSWFVNHYPDQAATLRLFCFPYAGGSAAIFRDWVDARPANLEIWAIEYPGRGLRRGETPARTLRPLAQEISGAIRPYLDRPFAFFGHSMGALVGFEVIRELKITSGPEPVGFFVSGCRGPKVVRTRRLTYDLPAEEFVEELRLLGGTPEEILADGELLRYLMPTLRADFEASETYHYRDGLRISCPVFAYGGMQDIEVAREELAAWQDVCGPLFQLRMFPGDHFFIHTAQSTLLRVLWRDLMGVMQSA